MRSHSQIQFCLLNFMTNVTNILQSEVLIKQKTCREVALKKKKKIRRTIQLGVGKLQPEDVAVRESQHERLHGWSQFYF